MDENNKGANGEGNPEESPTTLPTEHGEKKPEGEGTPPQENKQANEKPLPFNEDPKVMEFLERQWGQRETKLREEFNRDIEARFGRMTKKEEDGEDIPEWFGGDLKQWKSYLAHQDTIVKKAKEEAIEDFQNSRKAEEDKVKDANDWFEHSVMTIESLTGKKIDRNTLLAYTLEHQVIDKQNQRWDYFKAFKDMADAPPDKKGLDERRKLADGTMKEAGKPEGDQKTFKTSEDFKKEKPW